MLSRFSLLVLPFLIWSLTSLSFVCEALELKDFKNFPPEPHKLKHAPDAQDFLLPERTPLASSKNQQQKSSDSKQQDPKSQLAFWRYKPELQDRMREQRDVLVSAQKKQDDHEDKLMHFDVRGAGFVKRDLNEAFKLAQNYQDLHKVSEHFNKVYFDEKNQQLFLIIKALGYQARMILYIHKFEKDERKELQFEIIWGDLKGLKGAVGFEKQDDNYTEVSMMSDYTAAEFPLPKVFMSFAFEVLTEKIAKRMRSYLESEPK